MKSYNEESDEEYFLEVDVPYLKLMNNGAFEKNMKNEKRTLRY